MTEEQKVDNLENDKQDKSSASKINAVLRDENGRVLPGYTANPNGRPKETEEDKLRKKALKNVESDFKERILGNIEHLLTAQMNIAKGASYLYRIDKNKEGKEREHVLVTDPDEIKEVLDEVEGTGQIDDSYYYITTKTPDNKAIDSLIDRVFGKPKQSIEHSGEVKIGQLLDEAEKE